MFKYRCAKIKRDLHNRKSRNDQNVVSNQPNEIHKILEMVLINLILQENRFFHEYNTKRREIFNPAIYNSTFATGELQNRLNDVTSCSDQINNAQIQNAFASPHRTFSGFKMNKSKSNGHKSKDSSDNAKRKLTR